MFKIYSLALLSFLALQNSYAADEKEEFPGEASMRRRMTSQQHDVADLQQLYKRLFQEKMETASQLSNTPLKGKNERGNEEELRLDFFSKVKLEQDLKFKEFERYLDWFKSKQDKEREDIIEERRRIADKQKWEKEKEKLEMEGKFEIQKLEIKREIKDKEMNFEYQKKTFEDQIEKQKRLFEIEIDEIRRKEATKYRELGITSFLKGLDEENLPAQERSSGISLDTFPLTFDRPDKNNDRIYLRLSEEDQESLRASGVNHELIDNLYSHLQTDVSALYDIVQRGYRNRQEQNRQ